MNHKTEDSVYTVKLIKNEKLKEIDLFSALENLLESDNEKSNFIIHTGLEILFRRTYDKIGDKLKSCYIEYTLLPTSIYNNILTDYLFFYEKDNAFISHDKIQKNYHAIYNTLKKHKEGMFYFPNFFLASENGEALLSSSLKFEDISIEEEKEKAKNYVKEDILDEIIDKGKDKKKINLEEVNVKVDDKGKCYLAKANIENVSIDEYLQGLSEEADLEKKHTQLHFIFHKFFSEKEQKYRTYLISIPLVNASIGEKFKEYILMKEDKKYFNGLGACFILLEIDDNTDILKILKELTVDIWRYLIDITYNYLFQIGFDLYKRALNSSIKSSIAAIMSRNVSHNIGSHIISTITNTLNDYADAQYLFKYIQQRMDFIATITTEFPKWTYPAWFVRDIMRRFYEQRLLLKYIGRSEGLDAYEFQGNKKEEDQEKQSSKIVINVDIEKVEKKDNNEEKTYYHHIITINRDGLEKARRSLELDKAIAIPGGVIGNQAFYTILENIIRNSAKHAWAKKKENKPDNLEITILLKDYDDKDYYVVEIWDNVTEIKVSDNIEGQSSDQKLDKYHNEGQNSDLKWYEEPLLIKNKEKILKSSDDKSQKDYDFILLDGKKYLRLTEYESGFDRLPLHQQINYKLLQAFIDNMGRLKKENWGLSEMKISAGFLNKKDIVDIGSEDKTGDTILFYEESKESSKNGFIAAFAKYKKEEEKYFLGYRFTLPKPKEVLILNYEPGKNGIKIDDDMRNEAKRYSVYFKEDLSDLDYEFVVLFDNGENEFVKRVLGESDGLEHSKLISEIENYPYRLFIVTRNEWGKNVPNFLKNRVVLLKRDEFKNMINSENEKLNRWEKFKLKLYLKWIHSINSILPSPMKNEDEQNQSPINILINVAGEGGNTARKGRKIAKYLFEECKDDIFSLLNNYEGEEYEKYKELVEKLSKVSWSDLEKKDKKYREDIDQNNSIFNDPAYFLEIWYKIATSIDGDISFNEKPRSNDYLYFEDIVLRYWEFIESHFIKYEEEIKTFPEVLRANGDTNDGWDGYLSLIDANIMIHTDEKEFNKLKENKHISYNRHSMIECEIYSEALSGSQIYFSLLSNSSRDKYLRSKIVLQLLENAIIRMLIIDERVAQFVHKDEDIINTFKNMRITIPFAVKKEKGSEPIILVQESSVNEDDTIKLNEIVDNKYDVLIIHQGVLEKLIDSNKKNIGEYLNKLKEKIPFVVVTSGRGSPSTLPDDAKLLPFSNIESFILKSYPEKFLLTQTLMKIFVENNSREKRK